MSEHTHEPASLPSEPPSAVPGTADIDDDLLVALADEFAERVRCQERPVVEEYAARHPELADRIHLAKCFV